VGLSLQSATPVNGRITDLALRSSAMGATEHVNVMLPRTYDPSGATRYRTLYLLHGSSTDHGSFVRNGIEAMVGDLPLIVVMPDGGPFGAYSDWYGQTPLAGPGVPPPAWETFHVRELIPWIDAHYPTVGSRQGRAVAGVSMGGGGAMKYAARHPELFAAAGSVSGAVDIGLDVPAPVVRELLVMASLVPAYGPAGFCTWGDPVTQGVFWRDSDPTYLAPNLTGVSLFLASGNGLPRPGDNLTNSQTLRAMAGEAIVWRMNQTFVRVLDAARIPHTDRFHSPGTHTWTWWGADLGAFLAWLTAKPAGAAAPGTPADFSYRSAEPSFTAWDWSFQMRRTVREFVYLTGVSPAGLTARGSGALDVTTASVYQPGASYRVVQGGPASVLPAGADGRIRFTVDLGPSHTTQQRDFEPAATAGWRQVTVQIAAA
jgi:S-formylglutathione hydrolase FrmB